MHDHARKRAFHPGVERVEGRVLATLGLSAAHPVHVHDEVVHSWVRIVNNTKHPLEIYLNSDGSQHAFIHYKIGAGESRPFSHRGVVPKFFLRIQDSRGYEESPLLTEPTEAHAPVYHVFFTLTVIAEPPRS